MDDLDIIKQQWQQHSGLTDRLEETNRMMAERLRSGRISSLQERLARRYTRAGFGALALPVLAPFLSLELDLPWWVAVLYGLFGTIMSCANFWLAEHIRSVLLIELPVAESIGRALRLRLMQTRLRIAGLILGVSLVVVIALSLPIGPQRESIILGGAVGLAIGIAIGLRICLVNLRLTRRLLDSLKTSS